LKTERKGTYLLASMVIERSSRGWTASVNGGALLCAGSGINCEPVSADVGIRAVAREVADGPGVVSCFEGGWGCESAGEEGEGCKGCSLEMHFEVVGF
jgi:hypothetical protein